MTEQENKYPPNLSEREKLILRYIVQNYILTANPVGSRALSRKLDLGLSPSTVRNAMSDLEEMGLLTHPHTSAGRLPTDLGYRLYVNDLMLVEDLSQNIRESISECVEKISTEVSDILESIGSSLAEITKLLSVISAPELSAGELERIELIRIANERLMIVVIVKSGLVKTINLEVKSSISNDEIADTARFINERLVGLRLLEIPVVIRERLAGHGRSRDAVVRLFLDFPEKIFSEDHKIEMQIGGARYFLEQPEYQSPDKLKGIIELIEDKDVIVHLLKDRETGVKVTIGSENEGERLKDLSVITSTYRVGEYSGALGIIGPTRMNYSRVVALLDYTSKLVSKKIEAKES